MMKRMLGCGGVFWLLALAACGGTIQSVGDSASGAGGGNNAQAHAGSGSAQPLGGASNGSGNATSHAGGSAPSGSGPVSSGRGGAAWAPGTCDPPCSQGYGCYELAGDPAGLCAPLCDTPDQGQTADTDLSCANSVRGGAGTCVFSLGFSWPIPGPSNPLTVSSHFVTGLCSNGCDPILQDCPSGYTCDQTATYSAVAQQGLYACLPNKNPHAIGDTCSSTGDGECGPGLTCSPRDGNVSAATCTALCDRRDAHACSGTQVCTETVVTMQDNDPNIGVCVDACTADLQNDPANCGACGHTCAAGALCKAGECGAPLTGCVGGAFINCDDYCRRAGSQCSAACGPSGDIAAAEWTGNSGCSGTYTTLSCSSLFANDPGPSGRSTYACCCG